VSAPPRIVITRSREAGEPWRRRLAAAGQDCLHLPLIRYELLTTPADFTPVDRDWLLFTAPQGVRAWFENFPEDPPSSVAVLNDGTASALSALGHSATLNLAAADGAAMAAAFAARVAAPASLLLPGAEKRLAEPAATLRAAGFQVRELPLYRTLSLPAEELPGNALRSGDCLFFASPSTVRAFRSAWPMLQIEAVAIGETTAAACREAGLNPRVAAAPSLEALCAAAGLELPPPSLVEK
jgi:uroporphyrinogen-III synthase